VLFGSQRCPKLHSCSPTPWGEKNSAWPSPFARGQLAGRVSVWSLHWRQVAFPTTCKNRGETSR
jgi:hypothetical protein